ncbi:MAG: DUF2911 domain-containing protein [Chitinophagaceae bacterium]
MKKFLAAATFCSFLVVAGSTAWAQQTKLPPLALSPMDMAYYPPGYSMVANVEGKPEQLIARIIYCRPQIKGRVIFGGLVPYGKVWRLGANQATELDIFSPVTIAGHIFQPGRYTMYAIPEKDKWTIILNGQTDTWGAFGYHQEKDIIRTDVPVTTLGKPVEAFTMIFEKAPQGCNLAMAWDKAEVKLPISF